LDLRILMQFEAQARIATKMYVLYIAGANGACNKEMRRLRKFYKRSNIDTRHTPQLKHEFSESGFAYPDFLRFQKISPDSIAIESITVRIVYGTRIKQKAPNYGT